MPFIKQWAYMLLGIYLTYQTARWPGLEHHIAASALFTFGLAFRADYSIAKRAKR
ncbi:MAG: hypothetical protein KDD70_14705 [Bdellovibrionales bacterium]|nr:hypothetical protein [Bdellovibrionales bacterium]